MAGQWQREFFLITEDPFTDDRRVFDLWIEGYGVNEAAMSREKHFQVPESQQEIGFSAQFIALLRQDCAQQYEAFEFLEVSLHNPVHFLDFCPVHLTTDARQHFVESYYSLDNIVVREVLKYQNMLNLKVHEGTDQKATSVLDRIATSCKASRMKVQRIVMNLQRVCQWLEMAQSQRGHGSARSFGSEGERSDNAGDTELSLPKLEALGPVLRNRYANLAFVLLMKFDLWSKSPQALIIEQIEDVAAVLQACGGQPYADEARDRSDTPASSSEDCPFSSWVCDKLRQLLEKYMKQRPQVLGDILLKEFERTESVSTGTGNLTPDRQAADSLESSAPGMASLASSKSTSAAHAKRFGGLFARGAGPESLKAKVHALVAALLAGMVTVANPNSFVNFFDKLTDFSEKLKMLDLVNPFEAFQRIFNALEALGEDEKTSHQAKFVEWPVWLDAFRMFLEMYRVCVACILYSGAGGATPVLSPKFVPTPREDKMPVLQLPVQMSGGEEFAPRSRTVTIGSAEAFATGQQQRDVDADETACL